MAEPINHLLPVIPDRARELSEVLELQLVQRLHCLPGAFARRLALQVDVHGTRVQDLELATDLGQRALEHHTLQWQAQAAAGDWLAVIAVLQRVPVEVINLVALFQHDRPVLPKP